MKSKNLVVILRYGEDLDRFLGVHDFEFVEIYSQRASSRAAQLPQKPFGQRYNLAPERRTRRLPFEFELPKLGFRPRVNANAWGSKWPRPGRTCLTHSFDRGLANRLLCRIPSEASSPTGTNGGLVVRNLQSQAGENGACCTQSSGVPGWICLCRVSLTRSGRSTAFIHMLWSNQRSFPISEPSIAFEIEYHRSKCNFDVGLRSGPFSQTEASIERARSR